MSKATQAAKVAAPEVKNPAIPAAENITNGQPAEKTEPAKVAEPTLEELEAAAEASAERVYLLIKNGVETFDEAGKSTGFRKATPEEKTAAQLENYKITKSVTDKINADKTAVRQAEVEAKKAEVAGEADKLITLYDAMTAARDNSALSIDEKNLANNAYQSQLTLVKEGLLKGVGGVKTVLHVSMGTTGAQIGKPSAGKGAIGQQIVDLFVQGKTAADIIAQGFSRGTTHAVILAYQRSIGAK